MRRFPWLAVWLAVLVGELPAVVLLSGWWRPLGEVLGGVLFGGVRVWVWRRRRRRRERLLWEAARWN